MDFDFKPFQAKNAALVCGGLKDHYASQITIKSCVSLLTLIL